MSTPSPTRVFRLIDDSRYVSDDGWLLCREQGETPNGNPVGGRWVLRDQHRNWVDVNQYRTDIAAIHGFKIEYAPPRVKETP